MIEEIRVSYPEAEEWNRKMINKGHFIKSIRITPESREVCLIEVEYFPEEDMKPRVLPRYDIVYNPHFLGAGIGRVENGKYIKYSDHKRVEDLLEDVRDLLSSKNLNRDQIQYIREVLKRGA